MESGSQILEEATTIPGSVYEFLAVHKLNDSNCLASIIFVTL